MRFYAKLPSRVVALSFVACLVVVGAPALVSIIDDSYVESYDFTYSAVPVEDDFRLASYSIKTPAGESYSDPTVVMVVNDGVFSIIGPEENYRGWLIVFGFDKSVIDDGVGKIILTGNFTKAPSFRIVTGTDSTHDVLSTRIGDTDQYEIVFSSVDKIKIRASESDEFYLRIGSSSTDFHPEVLSFTVDLVQNTVIPYGEIIIGATGAILLLCALFATPFFGVKGYTGKKFWRR